MIDVLLVSLAIRAAEPKLPAADIERNAAEIASVAGDNETALFLVVTGSAETHFEERLARCACKPFECDGRDRSTGGFRAIGTYQLHKHWLSGRRPAEVCSDTRLGTELAAHTFVTLRKRFGGIRAAVRWFIGCGAKDKRVTGRLTMLDRLAPIFGGQS